MSTSSFEFDVDGFQPQRAAKKTASGTKLGKQIDWQREAVPTVQAALIAGHEPRLIDVIADIRKRHPRVKARSNFLGLALTSGINNSGGVGMLTGDGVVYGVRDNALWGREFLKREGMWDKFLADNGLDETAFNAKYEAMPTMAERTARLAALSATATPVSPSRPESLPAALAIMPTAVPVEPYVSKSTDEIAAEILAELEE